MGNMVITVSRQYGSGGKTIAAMLAQKLGINCYSREILKMASEDSGINERLFGMSDEKIRHAGWFKTLFARNLDMNRKAKIPKALDRQ